MKHFILAAIIFLLASCSDDNPEDYRNTKNEFNIYLVKPVNENMYREEVDLESLDLEKSPWVKSYDIEFYDWSAHTFYLDREVEKEELSTRNFVVASGNNRLFMGVFWPMYMSSFPMIPSIMPEDDWWSPKDVIRFNSFGWNYMDGLNENEEFKSELLKADLLREGISVDITRLKRKSPAILEYTFQVTNLDIENIYVLDPYKMGTDRFHYYTNGVSIEQNENYYWAQDFETTASDKISSDWYVKLLPGNSISRTIILEGYQSLPTGQVKAFFSFPGAYHLKAKEWKKPDGRIWIGDFRVEKEMTLQ